MTTWIVELVPFKLRQGVLIQGLPGMGFAGKIAVDYIIQELKLKKVAELYSEHLLLPMGNAGLLVTDDGSMRLPHYEFYLYEAPERDILFLTGDVQPVSWGQYEVALKVLEYFKKKGGVEVVAVCGTIVGLEEGKREVYFVADTEETREYLSKLGFKRYEGGTITGACGLVPGLARLKGFKTYILMSTTKPHAPDPEAGREVVKALIKLFGVKVSLENLDRVIEEIKRREEELEKLREFLEKQKEERKPEYYV